MMLTDEQYERIARWLDGERIPLTDAERAAADEVRRDESAVAPLLDAPPPAAGAVAGAVQQVMLAEIRRDESAVGRLLDAPVPSGVFQRVHRRVIAELARPQRRLMRLGTAAASVAAAAAILLAVAVWPETPHILPIPSVASAAVPVEVIADSVRAPEDLAVDLLAGEIERLEAEMLASAQPAPMDMGIDQVEAALEGFWLDDPLD